MKKHLDPLRKSRKNVLYTSNCIVYIVMMMVIFCYKLNHAHQEDSFAHNNHSIKNPSIQVPHLQLEKVSHVTSKNIIIYRIHNNSEQEVKNIKLEYTFFNLYNEKEKASLNDKTNDTIDIPPIAPHSTSADLSFTIDFKGIGSAFFEFKVRYNVTTTAINRIDVFINKEVLDYLLKNADDESLSKALNLAVMGGYKEAVETLLAKGADISQQDKYGRTPFNQAAFSGQREIIALLIDQGADVNKETNCGRTPLMEAARNGQKGVVELLIDQGADVNKETEYYNKTPLVAAAESGHTEVVELLIAKGADVNKQNKDGWTPLMNAALHGYTEVVELLIAKGANVNKQNKNDGWAPLFFAAANGYKEIVELLIDKGADVNKQDNDGKTPLIVAAKHRDNKEVVELLIDKGADVNKQDKNGNTPLKWAAARGHKQVVAVLKVHGAR